MTNGAKKMKYLVLLLACFGSTAVFASSGYGTSYAVATDYSMWVNVSGDSAKLMYLSSLAPATELDRASHGGKSVLKKQISRAAKCFYYADDSSYGCNIDIVNP